MVSAQDPKLEPRPNEVIVFTLTVPAIFMLGVTSGVISKEEDYYQSLNSTETEMSDGGTYTLT